MGLLTLKDEQRYTAAIRTCAMNYLRIRPTIEGGKARP
jgi:hypothetical protein